MLKNTNNIALLGWFVFILLLCAGPSQGMETLDRYSGAPILILYVLWLVNKRYHRAQCTGFPGIEGALKLVS